MKVGIVSRTATYAPFYGLGGAVELIELGSTAAGVDALLDGRVDVAATCPDALIASDVPLRIASGLVGRPPTTILASADVRAVADLRGRRIGTTAGHGSVSIFLRAALRAHGLERGDYREVVLGPTPVQAAALESGEIDAAMLTAPFDGQLAARGFSLLVDVGALLGSCAFTTLNVRRGGTASEDWRALRAGLETALRAERSRVEHDLRIDTRAIGRLVELMRADGIGVTRDMGEIVEEGATASRSR